MRLAGRFACRSMEVRSAERAFDLSETAGASLRGGLKGQPASADGGTGMKRWPVPSDARSSGMGNRAVARFFGAEGRFLCSRVVLLWRDGPRSETSSEPL